MSKAEHISHTWSVLQHLEKITSYSDGVNTPNFFISFVKNLQANIITKESLTIVYSYRDSFTSNWLQKEPKKICCRTLHMTQIEIKPQNHLHKQIACHQTARRGYYDEIQWCHMIYIRKHIFMHCEIVSISYLEHISIGLCLYLWLCDVTSTIASHTCTFQII